MFLAGRIQARTLPSYLVGQVVGATLGGLTIWTIANNASDSSPLGRTWDGAGDTNFATNLWTNDFMGFWPMVIAEVLFTALLVYVYLTVTPKGSTTLTSGGSVIGRVDARCSVSALDSDRQRFTQSGPVRVDGSLRRK